MMVPSNFMKSILITGCSSGVGRATALLFSNKGYRVYAGVRTAVDAEALTHSDSSGNIRTLILDVTDPEQLNTAVQTLEDQHGDNGLDVLVNNAGIARFSPLEFTDAAEIRQMFEVNTMGPIVLTQRLLPLLRKARGRIIIISSIAGKIAFPFNGPYSISKFGLEAFAEALRREIAPFGLKVSLLGPGAIATPMMDKVEEESERAVMELPVHGRTYYESAIRDYLSTLPNSREYAATPEKVASVVAHAAESHWPKARYMVTPDAKGLAFLNWVLPDRVFDALLSKLNAMAPSILKKAR
jgi:NAD(P)-dependent dehydrogenase (short-subunit alcohol dehydrogenase family)